MYTRKEEKTLTGAINVVNRYILAQESNCNEKRYGYDKVVKEFPVLTRLIKQAADKSNAQKILIFDFFPRIFHKRKEVR